MGFSIVASNRIIKDSNPLTTQTSIDEVIPEEIMLSILSYLNPTTLKKCSLVSKKWHSFTLNNSLWKIQCVREKIYPSPKTSVTIDWRERYKNFALLPKYIAEIEAPIIENLEGHTGEVLCLLTHENYLFTGSFDQKIGIWDLKTRKSIKTLKEHQGSISCLQMYGDRLLSGSWDKTIKLWDLKTFQCIETLKGHDSGISCFLLYNDRLLSGSQDKTIKIWDLKSFECIQTLEGHEGNVSCLQRYDQLFISGSWDKKIKIWDFDTLNCLKTLEIHDRAINCLQIYGSLLLSVSNKIIQVTDLIFAGFSPSIEEPNAKFINYANGKPLNSFQSFVMSMHIQGKLLFCGSRDHMVKVWDLNSFELIRTFRRHEKDVTCLQMHGDLLISGSLDEVIKIWNFNNPSNKKRSAKNDINQRSLKCTLPPRQNEAP